MDTCRISIRAGLISQLETVRRIITEECMLGEGELEVVSFDVRYNCFLIRQGAKISTDLGT